MWTYLLAAELEANVGIEYIGNDYAQQAFVLGETIKKKYWDNSKGMFADTPEKDVFSQHANALAILAGLVEGNEAKQLATKILSDQSLAPASIYFKYYLHQAATKAGLGNDYIKWLSKWEENIALGLTTWAEMSNVAGSRSDCHAWGSSPNVEFYRIVLGIDSGGPGFSSVRIEPRLGDLTSAKGTIPHAHGQISVSYVKDKKGKWAINIDLPENIGGEFVWNSKPYVLKAGKNSIDVN
jgi:alpha-L-rhamnosidase